jgi:membrane carboxypeptidase/penicillin-binding protein
MATNIVKKGTNRASAMAKTNKHAQRTPLPAKAVRKRTVAEVVAETAEAREEVRGSMRKTTPKAAPDAKAQAFVDFATQHGWTGSVEMVDDETIRATARKTDQRYDESIQVTWINGRVPDTTHGGVVYTVNKRTLMMRNVSAARLHIDGTRRMNRDLAPRRAGKVTVVDGVRVEREVKLRNDDEWDEDRGTVEGMFRLAYTATKTNGLVKYRKSLGVGYHPHHGEQDKCTGCDIFGCRETRPGAWAGPKVVIPETPTKKIIKRKVKAS